MSKKIYIIGKVSDTYEKKTDEKFFDVQVKLSKMGYDVFNPYTKLINHGFSNTWVKKKNLDELISCDAVYIMNCIEPLKMKNNIELKLALNFNLVIITGLLNTESYRKRYLKTSNL